MRHWSGWRVFALAAAYVALYLGVSAGILLRWVIQHRQPDGSFLWLIPTTYVRNYVAALLLPPLLLLAAWLIARTWGVVDMRGKSSGVTPPRA